MIPTDSSENIFWIMSCSSILSKVRLKCENLLLPRVDVLMHDPNFVWHKMGSFIGRGPKTFLPVIRNSYGTPIRADTSSILPCSRL